MRAKEFIIAEEIIDELDTEYVNTTIEKDPNWKHLGDGYTASVWQHLSEPDQVVKVVGGGGVNIRPGSNRGIYIGTVAFVHFCVDHGYLSKHFPILHGINLDDNEVLQIRLEKLFPLDEEVCYILSDFASTLKWSGSSVSSYDMARLTERLRLARILPKNKPTDIIAAIKLLIKAAPIYAEAHKLKQIKVDLHDGNWLQRADGTIVAADPWVSFDY